LNTWCKACYVKTAAAYQKANPEKTKIWDQRKHYRRKYNISHVEYEAMFEQQNGVCAICQQAETHVGRSGQVVPLAVDHDHKTGSVRALLCFNCNTGIGKLNDDPRLLRAAAEYILRYQD
jgi:hypothetical protein